MITNIFICKLLSSFAQSQPASFAQSTTASSYSASLNHHHLQLINSRQLLADISQTPASQLDQQLPTPRHCFTITNIITWATALSLYLASLNHHQLPSTAATLLCSIKVITSCKLHCNFTQSPPPSLDQQLSAPTCLPTTITFCAHHLQLMFVQTQPASFSWCITIRCFAAQHNRYLSSSLN